MIQKMLNTSIFSVILFSPLYLVRFSVFQIPTNLIEVLIGLTIVLWFFRPKKNKCLFDIPKIYWLSSLLIFLGIILSAFLNPNWTTETGIIKGWFVFPFLFALILFDQTNSPEKREKMLKFFYVSTSSVGLIGFFYLLNERLTFDGRLQAFYSSPNYLAMFLTPGIVIGFFSIAQIILMKKHRGVPFYFLVFSLLIMLTALYFTFSYGAWLSLLLSLLLSLGLTNLISRFQKLKVFLFILFLLILLFFLQLPHQKLATIVQFDPRSSLASRAMIWKAGWKIASDNSIWGIGPGNFQNKYLEYQKYFPLYLEWAVPQPHNLYLAFWLQSGLLGLLGFLLLVVSWIMQMIRLLKKKKDGFLEAAPLAVLFYFLIHGLIDTPYWKNDLSILFWITIALGLSFVHTKNAGNTLPSIVPDDTNADLND